MIHHITLRKPNQINHKRIRKEIYKLVDSGVELNHIVVVFNFVITDTFAWELLCKFKIIKNRIAFELNPINN